MHQISGAAMNRVFSAFFVRVKKCHPTHSFSRRPRWRNNRNVIKPRCLTPILLTFASDYDSCGIPIATCRSLALPRGICTHVSGAVARRVAAATLIGIDDISISAEVALRRGADLAAGSTSRLPPRAG